MPLEWWPVLAFAGPFALSLCTPNLKVLGVVVAILGALIVTAWVWLEHEMSAPNSGGAFGDAIVAGLTVGAALGLIFGAGLRLLIFGIYRSLRTSNHKD